MALRVYVGYGTVEDQVIALRLQALGAVHGLTVFVPPAHSRNENSLDPVLLEKLARADLFLGLTNFSPLRPFDEELNYCANSSKPVLLVVPHWVIASSDGLRHLKYLDPRHGEEAEKELNKILCELTLSDQDRNALRALATIARGLALLTLEAQPAA